VGRSTTSDSPRDVATLVDAGGGGTATFCAATACTPAVDEGPGVDVEMGAALAAARASEYVGPDLEDGGPDVGREAFD
jgi:hypothetical protein